MQKIKLKFINPVKRVTRGFGLLEVFLAKKRAKQADSLIDNNLRNGKILDIGCGCFPYFLKSTNFKEKHGLDNHIFTNSFDSNSIILKKVNIEKQKIPYKDNFFDTIVMLAVFEHISPDNLLFVLKEVHRVLKKDGFLILTTPSPWSAPVLSLFSKFRVISDIEINDHKSSFGSKEIIKYLIKAGFSKDKITNGYFELFFNMWMTAKK